jgi:hypothetical protein
MRVMRGPRLASVSNLSPTLGSYWLVAATGAFLVTVGLRMAPTWARVRKELG